MRTYSLETIIAVTRQAKKKKNQNNTKIPIKKYGIKYYRYHQKQMEDIPIQLLRLRNQIQSPSNLLGSKTLGLNVLELQFVMLANHDQNV